MTRLRAPARTILCIRGSKCTLRQDHSLVGSGLLTIFSLAGVFEGNGEGAGTATPSASEGDDGASFTMIQRVQLTNLCMACDVAWSTCLNFRKTAQASKLNDVSVLQVSSRATERAGTCPPQTKAQMVRFDLHGMREHVQDC